MSAAPDLAYERVLQFLELPDWKPETFARTYEARYQPMQPEMDEMLQHAFREPNRQLCDHLEMDFSWVK